MIHHVYGDLHTAHHEKLACNRYGCEWETVPEGADGKCWWCRESDKHIAELRTRMKARSHDVG